MNMKGFQQDNSTTSNVNTSDYGNTTGKDDVTDDEPFPYMALMYGTISKTDYELSSFILFLIIVPIICIVGTIGNTMSLAVLKSPFRRSSFHVFLTALTVCDVVILLLALLRSATQIIAMYNYEFGLALDTYVKFIVHFFLGIFLSKVSAFLIVVMSIERFIAVVFPLRVKSYVFSNHSRKIVAGVVVVQLFLHLPTLVWVKIKTSVDNETNRTVYFFEYAVWAEDLEFRRVFNIFIIIVNMMLPIFLVLATNLGIAVTIFRQRSVQRQIQSRLSTETRSTIEQNKTSVTLLAIGFFFVMCTAPSVGVYMVSVLNPNHRIVSADYYLYSVIVEVGIVLVLLNSANDFVIYILLSKRFKLKFLSKYGCIHLPTVSEHEQSQQGSSSSVATISQNTNSQEFLQDMPL